jgi:hypothetical protein
MVCGGDGEGLAGDVGLVIPGYGIQCNRGATETQRQTRRKQFV